MDLVAILANPTWMSEIAISLFAILVLYFVFRKTAELSRHAAENSIATLFLGTANIGVAVLFFDDLNALAQSAYQSLSIPTLDPKIWEEVPLWVVCLIGVASKDLVDYWNHRLMHTKWGWPTHAAHHSDTHVNAFTSYRIHFLEGLLMSFSYILLLTWMQIPQAIPFVVIFYSLHNKYVHMDLDFEHGPLKYLIASPVYHRWHHADVPEAYGKNLANVMPIYDVIFGTFYSPGKCNEPMGALKSGIADKNPILIFIYPFQEWARLIRASWANRAEKKKHAAPDNAVRADFAAEMSDTATGRSTSGA